MSTNIYAITDSHQESRNLSRLLSGIYNFEQNSDKEFIILDAGDLFKGIYDKDLSVNAYIKIKQLLPNAQIVITLGNNDFGFKKNDFEYLQNTIKKFETAGINIVCANLKNTKTNSYPDWVSRYTILNINGEKILITGFCLNNSCAKKFGYELLPPEETYKTLIDEIKEDYDKIIVLNHHWYPYSKNLHKIAGNIDLIIGGHEHSPIEPDYENNIFYPYSFARSMYKMSLDNKIKNVREVTIDEVNLITELEQPIKEYEEKTQLRKPIAKRVLNLTKCYSDPCPLGTFISDNMKKAGNTDIAFHSTGFTMYPLRKNDSSEITNYDLLQVMCADCSLVKIEITSEQLKKVFENATMNRMYRDRGNSRFVQCSKNIKLTGKGNPEEKTYKLLQIEIDGEKLLNENQEPLNPNQKFTCTIDPYIGSGEQGFEVLKDIPKIKILDCGNEVKINDLFKNALQNAQKEFTDETYPSFELTDLI